MEQMEREKEMKELNVENIELSRAHWEQDRKTIDAAIEKMKKAERPGGKTAVVVGGEEGVSEGQGNGLSGTQGGKLVAW
jgi:hypothetical protein